MESLEFEPRLKQRIEIAIPILNGLLASGHFTVRPDDDNDGILFSDNGKDYDKSIFACRRTSRAIEAALALTIELHAQAILDIANERPAPNASTQSQPATANTPT